MGVFLPFFAFLFLPHRSYYVCFWSKKTTPPDGDLRRLNEKQYYSYERNGSALIPVENAPVLGWGFQVLAVWIMHANADNLTNGTRLYGITLVERSGWKGKIACRLLRRDIWKNKRWNCGKKWVNANKTCWCKLQLKKNKNPSWRTRDALLCPALVHFWNEIAFFKHTSCVLNWMQFGFWDVLYNMPSTVGWLLSYFNVLRLISMLIHNDLSGKNMLLLGGEGTAQHSTFSVFNTSSCA